MKWIELDWTGLDWRLRRVFCGQALQKWNVSLTAWLVWISFTLGKRSSPSVLFRIGVVGRSLNYKYSN